MNRARVGTNPDGSSRGYGYVQYQTEEAAADAIERSNGMLLKGRMITVDKYQPREDRSAGGATNIYVKSIPESTQTTEDLEAIFSEFGDITSAFLPKVSSLRDLTAMCRRSPH